MLAEASPAGVHVIGCGALAAELREIARRNRLEAMTVECLPAHLHNTPQRIPDAVAERVRRARRHRSRVFVAYGDCGTGGRLDAVLGDLGVERLPGDHCYELFAGSSAFQEMHEQEPGTFYLTDYLVKHFDRIVWQGLGLDRHPELLADYFGNYRRLVYLAQTANLDLVRAAAAHANRLGLAVEHRNVGFGDVEPALISIGRAS